MKRVHSQTPARTVSRGGFTLMELTISLGTAAVLIVGMTSTLLVANAALKPTESDSGGRLDAAEVQRQILEDLHLALRFTVRTSTEAVFTVPDRNGDGNPDLIRYVWSGVEHDPLLYRYNSDEPIEILTDVQEFSLSYSTQTLPAAL